MFHLFFHMKISVVNTASMAIYELIYTNIIYPITGFIITYHEGLFLKAEY